MIRIFTKRDAEILNAKARETDIKCLKLMHFKLGNGERLYWFWQGYCVGTGNWRSPDEASQAFYNAGCRRGAKCLDELAQESKNQ